ncbi:DUF6680 family protein [Phenylobacterium sp.]|uniref:DUF6680 family protein n=1 Tax=Phenylobacterium sp. TaxID=1871053 RepID=UPI0035ADF600
MASSDVAAWVQAVAGIFTFGAAAWAVIAAYRAPKLAAAFADELRRSSTADDAIRNEKQWILSTLMRYRGQMLHHDVVSALNMVEITFVDSMDVRDAYRQWWNTIEGGDHPPALRRERFYGIITAIVADMGLGRKLRASDIERAYYPNFVGRRIEVELAETERRWNELHNPDGSAKLPPAHPG